MRDDVQRRAGSVQRLEHLLVIPVAQLGPSVVSATITGSRGLALLDSLAHLDDAVEQVGAVPVMAKRRLTALVSCVRSARVVGQNGRPLADADDRDTVLARPLPHRSPRR